MGVTAIFELPVPIWISTDLLGARISSGWRGLTFDVIMPSSLDGVGGPPELDDVDLPVDDPGTSEALVWTQRFAAFTPGTQAESTALCRVVLRTNGEASDDDQLDALALAVDPWFDALRTWVETITGQDLDPNHRVYDAVAHGSSLTVLEPAAIRDGPFGLTLTTPRIVPLPAPAWPRVLAAVAAGAEPPLEEQLTRDARAAFARDQLRRSVIDAASAAEIVLHRIVSARVNLDDLPNRHLRRKFEALDKQPLGGLVTLVREAELDLGVDLSDLEELSELRNGAIHRAESPDYWRASSVVQTAIDLLGVHGPWKRTNVPHEFGDEWIEIDASG